MRQNRTYLIIKFETDGVGSLVVEDHGLLPKSWSEPQLTSVSHRPEWNQLQSHKPRPNTTYRFHTDTTRATSTHVTTQQGKLMRRKIFANSRFDRGPIQYIFSVNFHNRTNFVFSFNVCIL